LALQLAVELPPDAACVKGGHLVLLEFSLKAFVELLDVVVESSCITLHFLNDELQFVLLPFLLFPQSFQMLLLDLVLSVPVSQLILKLLYLFPFILPLLIILLPLLLPPVLNILDELSVFLLCPDYLLMEALHSGI
jgi:hypothetical protein